MFQGCCFKSCIFIVAWRVTWSYYYSLFKLFENPNYIQILEQNFIVLTYSLHNVWGLVYLFLDLTIKSCPLIFMINARNSKKSHCYYECETKKFKFKIQFSEINLVSNSWLMPFWYINFPTVKTRKLCNRKTTFEFKSNCAV